MDLFVGDERVAFLESHVAQATGGERLGTLVELAWHLRERDTHRASALAREAAQLIARQCESTTGFAPLMARVQLTLAECDARFLDEASARREARRALSAFESAGDEPGVEAARWLLARLERPLELGGLRGGDELPRSAGAAALACHDAFAHGISLLRTGEPDTAVDALCRAAHDAHAAGLRELAIEARLAAARAFAALGDDDAARQLAGEALEAASANGWRAITASANALLSQAALRAGEATAALMLVKEAQAALSATPAARTDPTMTRLLAEAHLAAGDARAAFDLLTDAREALPGRASGPELAHLAALHARAAGSLGERERGIGIAQQALRLARDARTRAGQMEALRVLGELHGATAAAHEHRSAIAFLRHALDIAEDVGAPSEKASILRELARLHERCGDLAAALAAERAARSADACEQRRVAGDRVRAARAREARERLRLEQEHLRASQRHAAERLREIAACRDMHERLREAGHAIARQADPASIVEALEQHMAGVAEADAVALFVYDAAGQSVRRHARESGRAIPVRDIPAADVEPYVARCARERRELRVGLESGGEGEGYRGGAATLWFAPLIDGDRVLGVLDVRGPRTRAHGPGETIALRTLCGYAALALARGAMQRELARQQERCAESEERLQRLATTDALTGLSTRAHFFALARERLERMRRDGGPCGLIVGDVDGFRSVNDTRGHRAGDRVLAAVARSIAESLAGEDVAGRIGGEEFAVLLPGASLEATVRLSERIRLAVEALRVACDGRTVNVTVSFGCTAVADTARDIADEHGDAAIERMAREADAALCEAQGTGGNRTIAWPAYQALRALRTGEGLALFPQSLA